VPPSASLGSGVTRAGTRKRVTYLYRICSWFTEGFGASVLQEAKALLDELG
jgi:hypothetical protein